MTKLQLSFLDKALTKAVTEHLEKFKKSLPKVVKLSFEEKFTKILAANPVELFAKLDIESVDRYTYFIDAFTLSEDVKFAEMQNLITEEAARLNAQKVSIYEAAMFKGAEEALAMLQNFR